MGLTWRAVDTGLRPAAQNIALDRALLEARRAEEIPTTLRFHRYARCAVLGLQQSAFQELEPETCAALGIPIQRRIATGPALLMAPAHLNWSLYMHARELEGADVRAVERRLCHAIATAVSALGVEAQYRPRSEIAVDGRRIGGCGTGSDGDATLFHGTLYIESSLDDVVRALRMPAALSLEHLRAAAAERITDLAHVLNRVPELPLLKHYVAEALESDFDAEIREADLTLTEDGRYRAALPEIDAADWVSLTAHPASETPRVAAVERTERGELRAALIYDTRTQMLKQVWFTADPGTHARAGLLDLEAHLREAPLQSLERRVESFFGSRPGRGSLRAVDVVNVIRRAVRQPLVAQNS